ASGPASGSTRFCRPESGCQGCRRSEPGLEHRSTPPVDPTARGATGDDQWSARVPPIGTDARVVARPLPGPKVDGIGTMGSNRIAPPVAALLLARPAAAADGAVAAAHPSQRGVPIVATDRGAVRGVAEGGVTAFLGLPYAAPPTGQLRWRPPQ